VKKTVQSPILFTSLQAPNQDFIVQQVSAYAGRRLGLETAFVSEPPWQEREVMLNDGQIPVAWICGLPYVNRADHEPGTVELLVAPVMAAPRYADRPIYFSDVLVRRDSPFHTFEDLRGATWAYNEPNSQSGFNVTRWHLATLGEWSGYFGRVIEAGAHETALEMILDGRIDASAIDSTVLEQALIEQPDLDEQIRRIDILGPSPIPPWVISKKAPADLKRGLQQILLGMHQDEKGREILSQALMARFALVNDQDYDPIRQMAALAQKVRW
jgi:phosphonate transport system substrate-binding protein